MTRRALVVRGGWDGHAPEEAADLFVPFLREHDFDVTVEGSLEVYADAEFMAATDLVVQCWTMGDILADELRGLRTAVAAGTGLAGWHGGIVDSFRIATDYLQLVGAQFVAHPRGIVDHTITVTRPDHSIVEGIHDFALHSEQYWLLTDPLNEVLATTTITPGPGDEWHAPVTSPAVWTRRWGSGRVFVATPGHQLADLEVPQVRTIVERGMLWAAR
ncbi:ThuA domain-containing protein [Cellulomonas edaphi]|uniref:ThuA domain-containing protein n=1 Tax=Cellulomonas edaphi TaxID=3053468 RepID=A0ABT7S9V7_9CELL|nr:ThuA domain-containing protein [Cellulomons edaphi]MDM7832391.1 ThuA domain-containing protein [Cellulomons edaphi]